MSIEFLTVETVAGQLGLHPKTVLRFIREGRLRASKVGKQYRVLRSDLNAFAGGSPEAGARARVTSVVDVVEVDAVLLHRLTTVLTASVQGRDPGEPEIALNIAHDPARRSLKVIIVAVPADAAALLRLVDACVEDGTHRTRSLR